MIRIYIGSAQDLQAVLVFVLFNLPKYISSFIPKISFNHKKLIRKTLEHECRQKNRLASHCHEKLTPKSSCVTCGEKGSHVSLLVQIY